MTESCQEKRWLKPNGDPVSCTEKVMVMDENFEEIKTLLQDAIDDAVLLGCSQKSAKENYLRLIESIRSSYPDIDGDQEED